MKLYRDFFINVAAGWFFALFAAGATHNFWQATTAAVLCVSSLLLAEELDRWDA